MAGAIVSTLSERLTSMVADKIFQEVSLVTNFGEDLQSICDELDSIKTLLDGVREMPNSRSTTNWLHKVQDFLYLAVDTVEECEVRKFRNPIFRYRMGRRIKTLKKTISNIHSSAKYLKYLKSLLDVNARVCASNAMSEDKRKKSNALLTESRTVGMKNDIVLITKWILKDGDAVIAVVGIGGLGKTFLLQNVLVSPGVRQHFDHVVWLAVSKKSINVKELLLEMGKQINLPGSAEDLSGLSEEKLRDIIHQHLENKCCLLVLDDVWTKDALKVIGLKLQEGINNKIVITTRIRSVEDTMGAPAHHTHEIKCLSEEDGLELFCIHAFSDCTEHPAPPPALDDVSKDIVKKCRGLPLAINTIAASLARVQRIPNMWESTLSRLNQAEAFTLTVMPSLRLSYHDLPYHLKSCFLYCSVFPKNTKMSSEYLVYSWIAQGFVSNQKAEEAYDIGLSYIQELADRCLLEVSKVGGDGRIKYCKIHALLHDLAISESQIETKCLLKPGESVNKLPADECLGVRRISLVKNDIGKIEDDIQCPQLRTLLLWQNKDLVSISTSFFNNLKFLAVLDLSQTSMDSLPRSISKLKHLKLLNLSRTNIVKLPSSLSGLSHLQFLDVSWCKRLRRLHSGIGNHKFMLHLNVKRCTDLKSLPAGVAKLSTLQTLKGAVFSMENSANVLQLADLKKLTLLQHLSIIIVIDAPPLSQEIDGRDRSLTVEVPSSSQPMEAPSSSQGFKLGEENFTGMTKLRMVSLRSSSSRPEVSSRPLELQDMESIAERLERVRLHNVCLVPKWIFGLQNLMVLVLDGNIPRAAYKGLETIPHLRKLRLSNNKDCEEFPGEFGAPMAFPSMKKLMIEDFNRLTRFPILQDTAMPKLEYLRIIKCNNVLNILQGFEKLNTLNEVEIEKKDLRDSQSLKEKGVKIKVIDPLKVEAIEKMVKDELKKLASTTELATRVLPPPENREECVRCGLSECVWRGRKAWRISRRKQTFNDGRGLG